MVSLLSVVEKMLIMYFQLINVGGMNMAQFAAVGDFCPNPACRDYEKAGESSSGNIIRFGRTRSGRQRYKCRVCGGTFTETRGTIFYRRRTDENEILECLALIAEGSRLSSVSRVKGHKKDTISAWISDAAEHAEAVENILMSDFRIARGQLDGLWSYVGNKGEKKGHPETEESGVFFRSTMLDTDSRLRVARGLGKTETDASVTVFRKLKEHGHPDGPPPAISDGWGGIREAMVEVYGEVPKYSGKGRPPSKKQPRPGWRYLQVVKQRDRSGNFLGTRLKAVYGDKDLLVELLGKSVAYVERTHLTMRAFSSRLTRKGIAFSKKLHMHKACAALEDIYYNLIRPLKTLHQKIKGNFLRKWKHRTPAMAAGLTDHIWTLKELFKMAVIG